MSALSSMSQSSFARRGERDALAVGRPGRLRVLEVAVGDLLRLGGAVGRDDVEVPAPVARPADAVELELEPLEPPRRALLVVLFLVRLVRDARGERRSASRPATTPARRRPPSDRSGTAARRRRRASRTAGGAPSRRRASRRRPAASPSGDQRGCASFLPVVNRRGGSEPSVFASQIDWRYSFSSLSIDQTTYATSLLPGRRRGSETPVSS